LSSINTTNGNSISSWAWDFGDGQLVTDQNPPGHLYADENIYDVELIVVSNNGCSDTIIKTTAIYPNPVVSFSVPDVCSLSPAEFSDASTVSTAHSSNQINDWAWDFGDGNTDDVQNPVHTYAIDSLYNAVLTITTDHNCSAKDSVTVTVFPKPKAKFLNDSLCLGGNSVFQDLSSINSSNGDQIIDWSWDFDDDSVSNTQNPDHTYLTPGNYNTELIVTSDFGCKDTANGTVIVHANPTFSLDIALPNCGQGDGEIVITPKIRKSLIL
jgi:PKD repeat protein